MTQKNQAASSQEDFPRFVIPEILKDIRPRINTYYPVIKRLHAEWLYENYGKPKPGNLHGAIERLDSLYDASVFPDGLPERVVHNATLLTLIFQCDDLAISDPELCEKIVVADPNARDARILDSIWQTIQQHAPSDAVYQRVRGHWIQWMQYLKVENEFRRNWRDADMESFLKVRLAGSGMQGYVAAIEYVLDVDASDLMEDPDLKRAVDLVSLHGAITNDVYSYPSEYFTQDSVSVISILRNTRGFDAQKAIDTACDMLENMYRELAEVIGKLHQRYAEHPLGERLHVYLDGYLLMVAGSLQWHRETPRYGGPGYLWDGLPMRHVDLTAAYGEKIQGAGASAETAVSAAGTL